ncbi:Protein phosphatase 1 regulatory inhibitor subunit PPP1R7-like isoform B [Glycine soja]|uniref:Mitochondrial import inner membrane translocase subunit Tim21 n=1 Tax=Glycine soja TaxID=3848 RepID=A0A445JL69_GLYSO|nr:Protein phosphatase 1 regulatory inhibitor subunit PPP1R7-like isoform B [Glycine soja]
MKEEESIVVLVEDEDVPSSTLLDLTSYQLHDLDLVELPPCLTVNRLSMLDLRIGNSPFSLRQNLITNAVVLPFFSQNGLSTLENIPDVGVFKKLLVFNVAFNEISSLHGFSRVSDTLKELYVSKNEVAKIEEIEHFHQLQLLELGSNKLWSPLCSAESCTLSACAHYVTTRLLTTRRHALNVPPPPSFLIPRSRPVYSKTSQSNEADETTNKVRMRIGFPITCHGQESRNRAACQRIPHRVWTDEEGVEHVEVNTAAEVIYDLVDPTANLIFGAVIDPSLSGQDIDVLNGDNMG